MGTNKRYPDAGAQQAQDRRLQEASAAGPLQTLTPEQLQLTTRVISIAPEQPDMHALAWVRFGDADVRAPVVVKRWTPDAVGVEISLEGETLRCWVWQGAVERVDAGDW